MIIEDDCFINNRLELDIATAIPPDGFDLVYLTSTDHNKTAAITQEHDWRLFKVVSNWWETPVTLWSGKFADSFISYIEQKLNVSLWLGHIDHELMKLNETGNFAFYGVRENLADGLSSSRSKAPESISFDGSISDDIVTI